MDKIGKAREYFEEEAKRYSDVYDKFTFNIYDKAYQLHRRNRILANLDIYDSMNILDLGCGGGHLLVSIIELNNKINLCGADLSLPILRIAYKKTNGASFINCNAEILPFKDESFDIVIISGLLQYLENIESFFNEVYRIVKFSGKLIMTYPKKNTPFAFFRENKFGIIIREKFLKMPSFDVKFSKKMFIELLNKHGFIVKSIEQLLLSEHLYNVRKAI